jgi:hypothetical protein
MFSRIFFVVLAVVIFISAYEAFKDDGNPLDSAPDPGQYGRVRSRAAKCVRRHCQRLQ